MSEFLPPVVAVLAADIAPYLAGLVEGQARMAEFVTAQNAAITELEARFATLGTGTGAGLEAGLAKADESMTKFGIDAKATATEVDASFAQMGVAVEATGAKLRALGAEEAAIMAELKTNVAGMAAAQKEATLGQAALGDAMAGTGAKAAASGGALGMSKGMIVGLGAAALGAAYETTKMAADFQTASTRLVTSAGEDSKALDDIVKPGMLAMAGQLGVAATQLAKDLYPVESAGYRGAAGLKVLEAAEKGAKAEGAEGAKVTDALTSALHDYYPAATSVGDVTKRSNEIMSAFLATTSQGKMSFDQMAGGMNNILPTASALHIKLEDVLGVLASMTAHGISVQQATENMNHAMQKLASGGTASMNSWAASVGLSMTDIQQKLGERGLGGSLELIDQKIKEHLGPDGNKVFLDLSQAVQKSTPAIQELTKSLALGEINVKDYKKAVNGMTEDQQKQGLAFLSLIQSQHQLGSEQKTGLDILSSYGAMVKNVTGDMTTAKVEMFATGENTNYTNESIKKIGDSMRNGAGIQKAWGEVQQNFNQKLAEAKDGLGALAISIGSKLLPVLTPMVSLIAAGATWLSNHQAVATVLAFIIGGTLVVALVAGTVAMWGFASAGMAAGLAMIGITAPLWVVIGVVAAVGLAVYEVITHWQGIAGFFKGVWHAVQNVFEDALGFIMAPIHAIEKAWDSFMGGFQNPAAKLADTVKGFDRFFIQVGQKVKQGWDTVVRFFQQSPEKMADAVAYGLGRLTGIIVRFVESLPQKFGDAEHWLVQKGKDLLVGMLHGAEDGAKAVWTFLQALPGNAVRFVGAAEKWLVQKGKDALVGLAHGAEDGAKAVWDFLMALPGHVIDFFKAAPGWLYDAGKNILTGLWNGFTGKVGEVYNGIKGFISGVISSFMSGFRMSSPSQVMHEIGDGVIQGLWNGALGKIDGFLGWARGIPGSIIGAVGNLGSILYNAGAAAMTSLYNGFLAVWNSVKGWLSSVGGWIQSLKGPLDKDKTLLTPHGNAIMQGLMDGMKAQMPALRSQLGDVTKTLTTMGGTSRMGLSVSGSGSGSGSGVVFSPGASAGGGGAVTNLHVTVNGSMWTTQTLMKEMQQAFLQHGMRNVTPGLQSGFA